MKKVYNNELVKKAKDILMDPANWIDQDRWVSRMLFHTKFIPLVDAREACRFREQTFPNGKGPQKEESVSTKVYLGSKRICQHIENRIRREMKKGEQSYDVYIRLPQDLYDKISQSKHAFNGESKTIKEWSDKLGIKESIIYRRIKDGWSIERALTTQVSERKKAIKTENPES
jgi:hypothetical protein